MLAKLLYLFTVFVRRGCYLKMWVMTTCDFKVLKQIPAYEVALKDILVFLASPSLKFPFKRLMNRSSIKTNDESLKVPVGISYTQSFTAGTLCVV